MKKIKQILTKAEILRLKNILKKEINKQKNSKYYATLSDFLDETEKISFHEHYIKLLYFLKNYKTKIDSQIKEKLKDAYKNREIDISIYKKNIKRKFIKYKKKDYMRFLNRAEFLFDKYVYPFPENTNENFLNRIYLGMAFEFLLKAIYLKKGFLINEINKEALKKDGIPEPKFPIKLSLLKKKYLITKTVSFDKLITNLNKIAPKKVNTNDFQFYIELGLLVVQNWRNQDIHTPTGYFEIDSLQYKHILDTYYSIYKIFLPKIEVKKFPRKKLIFSKSSLTLPLCL